MHRRSKTVSSSSSQDEESLVCQDHDTVAKRNKYKKLRRRQNKQPLSSLNNKNNTSITNDTKKKRRCHHICHGIVLLLCFIILATVMFLLSFALVWFIQNASDSHGVLRKQRFHPSERTLRYANVYQKSYDIFHNNPTSEKIDEEKNEDSQESYIQSSRNNRFNMETYSDQIRTLTKCKITVLFMDPRIPFNPIGSPSWYTLESIAMFLPDACVLIQTSNCIYDTTNLDYQHAPKKYNFLEEKEVYHTIYNSSLPLFKKMIQNGQVRVTILNHTKYKLPSCDNFYNPSNAFLNINYWGIDEFIDGVDSDLVFVGQDDSILCHEFDIEQYRQYAFVGALWPKQSKIMQDLCVSMKIHWKTWTLPQRQWERFKKYGNHKIKHPKPEKLLDLNYPTLCNGINGLAPLGNGGFSLRSRKYMIQAIETCPHLEYSGIEETKKKNIACRVYDKVNEDVYFATILRGLKAPIPSAFEASLFALESTWPEDSLKIYGGGPSSYSEQKLTAKRLWGQNTNAIYQGVSHKENYYTVPAGIH